MFGDVVLLDLRLRRRSMIAYALGMAVYTVIVVALYPSFKNDTGLGSLTEKGSAAAALFGANGPLTSPTGWLTANIYGNFLPLVLLMLTIGYGASAIAGQDEDRTLGVVAALPLDRRAVLTQKFVTMCLQAVPVSVATALCVLVGRAFDLPVGIANLFGITVGALLLAIVFGAMALLVGVTTGSRGASIGITSATAALSYLISSLATAVDWLRPARFASLFYYSVSAGQLANGLQPAAIGVLVVAAGVLYGGALVGFARFDIH